MADIKFPTAVLLVFCSTLLSGDDTRLEVTQVGTRTVNIEEIVTPAGAGTIEAEIKAPTVIGISLHYSF